MDPRDFAQIGKNKNPKKEGPVKRRYQNCTYCHKPITAALMTDLRHKGIYHPSCLVESQSVKPGDQAEVIDGF